MSGLRRLVLAAVILAVAGAGWLYLAPGVLGGSTSYVVTTGTSMQPRFHGGDLAVVRRADDYRVGDIVAYRSGQLRQVVLHRIVARDGARYVFKGDNNGWRDPEHPTRSQLVGKLWLHVPGLGRKLERLRTPGTMAVLAGLGALLLLGGAGAGVARRRRRRRQNEGTTVARPSPRPSVRAAEIALGVSGLALAGFLALGVIALTRPARGLVPSSTSYEQSGVFSYSAPAPRGAAYPAGEVTTGQPAFLRLVDELTVLFSYRFEAASPHRLEGTAGLRAELAAPNGWKRSFQLEPDTPFTGDDVTLAGTLQLRQMRALVDRLETATEVNSGEYTLTLEPTLRLRGSLAGGELVTTFAPQLPFTLDARQLRPNLSGAQTSPASPTTTSAGPTDPLKPSSSDTLTLAKPGPATLSIKRLRVRIALLRIVAAIGVLASGAVLLLAALLLLRGRRADEPSRIRARYGQWLIPVARSDRRTYDEVVEVASIDTLAQLAERYDRLILHQESELGHSYRVADDGVLYVYLVGKLDSDELTRVPPPTSQPAARDRPTPAARPTRTEPTTARGGVATPPPAATSASTRPPRPAPGAPRSARPPQTPPDLGQPPARAAIADAASRAAAPPASSE